MTKVFNIWRFLFSVGISKTFLWANGADTHWFHVGTFTDGENTALKIVILPFSLMIGFAKW